jgi:OOP family OmpA-OmpF porin
MKRKLLFVLSLAVLPAVITAPAFCELKGGSQHLSPTFGAMFWDLADKGLEVEDISPFLGARYAVYFNERFGVQGNFGILPSSNSAETRDYNFLMVSGDAILNLATGNVIPYALGGVGYIKNWSQEEHFDLKDPYYEFGGGLRIFTIESSWIGIDVRDVIIQTDVLEDDTAPDKETYQNLLATFEFGFQWGGGPPPDTDMDGVPDKKDNCPDTPMGAIVDERGCPIDTDGDGVFDGLDKCPGTPAGATVDNTGCPKDTDADGVLDGLDKCASTPKGATVDATGCPQDTDNDGIFDGLDKCPDTRAGARVDATGCEIKEIEFEFLSKERLELYVNFKSGSAEIMDESKPLLNDVGGILVKWSEVRVEIAGHTDSQGGEDFNMKLSQKRAESVRDYLLQNFPSIGQDRMLAQGYGEMQPIAPNDTKEGMAKNRRVEVKVLNPETLKKALPEQ